MHLPSVCVMPIDLAPPVETGIRKGIVGRSRCTASQDGDGEGEEEEEWRQDEAGQAVETYVHAHRRMLACSDYRLVGIDG